MCYATTNDPFGEVAPPHQHDESSPAATCNCPRRRRRVVSFPEEPADVQEIVPAASLLAEQVSGDSSSLEASRKQLWYQGSEIVKFKKQAQKLSKKLLRAAPAEQQQGDDRSSSNNNKEEIICTRGLEPRLCPGRHARKRAIVQCVVKAQFYWWHAEQEDILQDQELYLAFVLREHSAWTRNVALAQGHRDYYEAHRPEWMTAASSLAPHLPCPEELKDLPEPTTIGGGGASSSKSAPKPATPTVFFGGRPARPCAASSSKRTRSEPPMKPPVRLVRPRMF